MKSRAMTYIVFLQVFLLSMLWPTALTTSTASATAPDVSDDETLALTLAVDDGKASTDSVTVLAPANVYWEEGFENLTQAPSYPEPSPFDYVEQGNGSYYYPDKNIVALEHGIVRHGNTSLELAQTRSGSNIDFNERRSRVEIHWNKHGINSDELWRSGWIYIPKDFVCGNWIAVLEYKEVWDDPYEYAKWYLALTESGGELYLMFTMQGGLLAGKTTIDSKRASRPIPKGKWVWLQVYFRRDAGSNGQMIAWQDVDDGSGVREIINVSGFTSKIAPSHPRNKTGMKITWEYYSAYGANTLYFDDLVVANQWIPRDYVPGGGGNEPFAVQVFLPLVSESSPP